MAKDQNKPNENPTAETGQTPETIKQNTRNDLQTLQNKIREEQNLTKELARDYLKQLDDLQKKLKDDPTYLKAIDDLKALVSLRANMPQEQSTLGEWTAKWEQLKEKIITVGATLLKTIANFLKSTPWLRGLIMSLAESKGAQTKDLLKAFPSLVEGKDLQTADKEVESVRLHLNKTAKAVRAEWKKKGNPDWEDYDFVSILKELKETRESMMTQPSDIKSWLSTEATNILARESGQAEDAKKKEEADGQLAKLRGAFAFTAALRPEEMETLRTDLVKKWQEIQEELKKRNDPNPASYNVDLLITKLQAVATKDVPITQQWIMEQVQKLVDAEKATTAEWLKTNVDKPAEGNAASSAPQY